MILWKSIGICVYFILMFLIELNIYREPFFVKSESIINFLNEEPSIFSQCFFQVMSFLGNQGISIISIITIPFLSLNKLFTLILCAFSSLFFVSLLKVVYIDPRPYWVFKDTFHGDCEIGYGNPSGHSMVSTTVYLSFWNLITSNNYFHKRQTLTFCSLFVTIFIIICIMTSRLFLGVHSLDQVIFGFSLGIGVYYLFFHIICLDKLQPTNFMETIWNNKLCYIGLHIIFTILLVLIYLFQEEVYIEEYKNVIKELCPNKYKKEYRVLKNDSLFGGLIPFYLLGMYIGVCLLYFFNDRIFQYEIGTIIELNKETFTRKVIRYICFTFSAFPGLLFLFNYDSIILTFIFKVSVPLFLVGFFMFFPGIIIGLYLADKCETIEEGKRIEMEEVQDLI